MRERAITKKSCLLIDNIDRCSGYLLDSARAATDVDVNCGHPGNRDSRSLYRLCG